MLMQLLSLLVVILATRVLWRRWKYDLHRMPSPPGLPNVGHAFEFICGQPNRALHAWLKRSLHQLGNPKIMRVDFVGMPWLFVSDLKFIKDVMFSKASSFPRFLLHGAIIPMIGNDASAKCVLNTGNLTPYVKSIRRVYASAWQTNNLKIAIPKLNGVLQKMINIIEAKRGVKRVEFQSLCVKMVIDAIGVVALDSNLGAMDGSRSIDRLLTDIGNLQKEQLTNPLKSVYFKLFPNSKEAKKAEEDIANLTAEWNKLTNEILEKDDPPESESPFWFLLRKLKDPETEKPVSYNTLRAEVGVVIITGSDTTGHQMGWLFALLAAHPHVVDRLLKELSEHGLYGSDAREVTFEDVGQLTYLTAIIREGMRLGYVGVGSLLHLVPEDMNILGYRVPKDTLIMATGTRSCCTTEEWGDPDVFRPERWLGDEDMSNKYSLGFAFGPRDCIGQRLAMLMMRLTIIKLITQFQFILREGIDELLRNAEASLVIEAPDGIWLDVKPRSAEL